MLKNELKLEYKKCDDKSNGIPVIIAAAGMSSRMGKISKMFADIAGIPVIVRTMLAFERCNMISKIILATKEEDIVKIQLLAEKYMITKLKDIVIGGDNRQQSIKNCIDRLCDNDIKVLIHDGARPLVSDNIICSVVSKLLSCDAVACGVKVKDTIKKIDDSGIVLETINRENLISVQTPQGVTVSKYKEAINFAGEQLSSFTDDMSVMENAGYSVQTVTGSYSNIKITTKQDISIAESYILRTDEWCE